MPYGHPDWGRLFRCDCGVRQDDAVRHSAALKRLGDELGGLLHCTFDAFDLDRPLEPIYTLDNRYYARLNRVPMGERAKAKEISVAVQAGALNRAYDAACDYAQVPTGWLCLHGSYGGGKSHLAAAICHVLVDRGLEVRYRSVPGMLDAIKAGFKDDTADVVFDDLLGCDLLTLDDLGAQHLTGWSYERLFRLLNERLDRPTVITTNVHPDDLGDPSDVDSCRLASRIAGAARNVWLPISDYRRLRERVA